MPWHRVIIKHSADAHLSAQGLMIPFAQQDKEAGAPERGRGLTEMLREGIVRIIFPPMPRHLRKNLLQTFHATRCFAEPNLESCRKIRL